MQFTNYFASTLDGIRNYLMFSAEEFSTVLETYNSAISRDHEILFVFLHVQVTELTRVVPLVLEPIDARRYGALIPGILN